MLLPSEIETRTSIPALRALVARRLIEEYRLTQKQAAEVIGVTQAAISNYLRGTRGTLFTIERDDNIHRIVGEISAMMVKKSNQSLIVSKFAEACRMIRTGRMLCDVHKRLEPTLDPESCHVCDSEGKGGSNLVQLKMH